MFVGWASPYTLPWLKPLTKEKLYKYSSFHFEVLKYDI
jgi:hypothetical protein